MIKNRLLIIFCCFSSIVFSQNKKQVIELAEDAFKTGHYQATIDLLEDYTSAYPQEMDANFLLAKSYFELNDFENAQTLLKLIYNKDRDRKYIKSSYLLAKSYQQLGNYRYAKRYYQRALTPYRRDRNSLEYVEIKQAIESCEFAAQQQNKPFPMFNLGDDINTSNADYGFIKISESEALYSSVSIVNGKQKSRIFLAEKIENNWKKKSELHFKIDTNHFQVANPFYYKGSDLLFFSLCDSNRMCNIAYAKFDSLNKLVPQFIEAIKSETFTNTQPTIAAINKSNYLIYASNRSDGKGGLDLWASKLENDRFQTPFNLGEPINSPGNEITPFYQNGKLYFSSDWHKNIGGYDVFEISTDLKSNYGEIINLIKVNSPQNDLYFSLDEGAYFLTSNRKGSSNTNINYCCNDIFYLINDFIRESIKVDSLQIFFPLVLYFDNDQPKPNNSFAISDKDYNELLKDYKKQKSIYLSKSRSSIIEQDDIEDFFDWSLPQDQQLEKTFEFLLKQLRSGDSILLLVQGFSSTLANKDYNFQLSERRINSFIQSLEKYEDKKLLKYLQNGQLSVEKEALGEGETDRDNQDKNSIYSIDAMLDRKIEVKAIRITKRNRSNK